MTKAPFPNVLGFGAFALPHAEREIHSADSSDVAYDDQCGSSAGTCGIDDLVRGSCVQGAMDSSATVVSGTVPGVEIMTVTGPEPVRRTTTSAAPSYVV